jgi:hypothetical protein
MPHSSRLALLVALLPAACAPVSSPGRAPSSGPPPVSLRFAWPEPFSVRVLQTSEIMSGETTMVGLQRQYWLKAEPGGQQGQYRLVVHDMEISPPEAAAFADPEPTVLYDRAGGFLGVERSEQMPGEEFSRLLPLSPEQQAQVSAQVATVMEEAARERWGKLVGRWRGLTLTPGEPAQREVQMWVGRNFLERQQVAAQERISVEAGVQCSPQEQERRCVRLSTQTVPSVSRSRLSLELVTDPDTLMPYSLRTLRTDVVGFGEESDENPAMQMQQAEEYRFIYGSEPVPAGSLPL